MTQKMTFRRGSLVWFGTRPWLAVVVSMPLLVARWPDSTMESQST